MNSVRRICLVLLVLCLAAGTVAAGGQKEATAERVSIDFWTHWVSNNPVMEPFWVELATRFNQTRPEVDFRVVLNDVPYEGYEAKYYSAFEARRGPGMFNEMTHVAAGQYDVCDPMPQDLAAKADQVLIGSAKPFGVFDGVRYGLPVEGGNFMMMYINEDLYRAAGLDPNQPPKTYAEMLEHAQRITKYDSAGRVSQAGFAIRFKGHPFGIADKSACFYHAWGAEWMNWDEKRATGYLNSPEAIGALEYYADLVQKHKVATVELDTPENLFAQGLAGIFFRESWYEAWLAKNAPSINFKVYPLPREKMESGYTNNFPWAYNVSNQLSERDKKWLWEFLGWYVNSPEVRREHYVKALMLPAYNDIDDPVFRNMKVYEAWKTMAAGRAAPTYYVPPAHETLTVIGQATLDAMYGKMTPKEALDRAARDIDTILARYK